MKMQDIDWGEEGHAGEVLEASIDKKMGLKDLHPTSNTVGEGCSARQFQIVDTYKYCVTT